MTSAGACCNPSMTSGVAPRAGATPDGLSIGLFLPVPTTGAKDSDDERSPMSRVLSWSRLLCRWPARGLRSAAAILAVVTLAMIASACGDSADDGPVRLVGFDEVTLPLFQRSPRYPDGPLVLNGADGRAYLVDSSNPWTYLADDREPFSFGPLSPEQWTERVGAAVGDLNVARGPVTDAMEDLVDSVEFTQAEFGGVLGADYLVAGGARLDFVRRELTIGSRLPEAGIAPVGSRRSGAGTACVAEGMCFDYGNRRLTVDFSIDGVPLVGLVHTAARAIILAPQGYERLQAEVALFDGDNVMITDNPADEPDLLLTVASSVRFGDQQVDDQLVGTAIVNAGASHPLAATLDRFERENGFRVDAFIGLDALKNFDVYFGTDDGLVFAANPHGQVEPQPVIAGMGIGTDSKARPGCWTIDALISSGLSQVREFEIGDCILSVAGVTPADMAWGRVLDTTRNQPQVLSDGQLGWPGQVMGPNGPVDVEFAQHEFLVVDRSP